MKKQYTPAIRRWAHSAFCKKPLTPEKKFQNLVTQIRSNKPYSVIITGYSAIFSPEKLVHSVKTVSLYFHPQTKNITVAFFNAYDSTETAARIQYSKTYGLLLGRPRVSMIQKIHQWLMKEQMDGFKADIRFETEYPMFQFKLKTYTKSIGTSFAMDVVNSIWKSQIKGKNPLEIRNFLKAIRNPQHLTSSLISCKVYSLTTDKIDALASDTLAPEIGHQLYQKMAAMTADVEKKMSWFQRLLCYLGLFNKKPILG
ncbi:MAG: hypothetical protein V4665_04595 [Patescibacteria group bacterium]